MPSDRFLSRWSKRKAQNRRARPVVEAEAAAAPSVAATDGELGELPEVETTADVAAVVPSAKDVRDPEAELTEDELHAKAEELGLPSVDSLGPDSDFKPFMGQDVPSQLRNLALRRLWPSNPVLANLDGLVDYGEDFTDAATVVANLQTAYQVGRGYRRDPEPEEIPDEETPDGVVSDGVVSDGEVSDGEVSGGTAETADESGGGVGDEVSDQGDEIGAEDSDAVELAVGGPREGAVDTDRRQEDGDRT